MPILSGPRILEAVVLASFLLLSAPSRAGSASDALVPLIDAISERIAIADKVALSKWHSKAAVEDAQREKAVLDVATAQAQQFLIAPDRAQRFFSAQIEANKLVQYGLLWQWVRAGQAPPGLRPDLKIIRQQLDRLQIILIEHLARFAPYSTDAKCDRWVAAIVADAATDDLHRWALVRATGDLCARHE